MLTIVTIINIRLFPKSVTNLTGFSKSVNIHTTNNTNQNTNFINQNVNCIKNIKTLAIIISGPKIGSRTISKGIVNMFNISENQSPPFKLAKHSML